MKYKMVIIFIFRFALVLLVLFAGFIATVGSGDPDWLVDSIQMYTSVSTDDLNNDGLLDIAIVYVTIDHPPPHPSTVAVLLQDPNEPGTFQSADHYSVGGDAWSIAIGDLNGDDLPDIATANTESDDISILFQDLSATGKFLAAKNFSTDNNPNHVAIGDINLDGFNDLAVADRSTSILLQDPNTPGTFLSATMLGFQSGSVAIGDLNADNIPDLVTTGNSSEAIGVSFQDPMAAMDFFPATYFDTGPRPCFVAIGDIDGDLLEDLAVATRGSSDNSVNGGVSVLLQDRNSPGNFLMPNNYNTGNEAQEVVIEDLDGDNLPDLAVATGSKSIKILMQDPLNPGAFNKEKNYEIISQTLSIAVGDLNDDSLPDIAVADDGAYVLFQNPDSLGNYFSPMRVE